MISALIALLIFAIVVLIIFGIIAYIVQRSPIAAPYNGYIVMAIWVVALLIILIRALPMLGVAT